MGLFSAFKVLKISSEDADSTSVLPTVPEDGCDLVCDTCTTKFPSSLKIETEDKLWGTVRPWRYHILVATGKTDWAHGLGDEKSSVSVELGAWAPKDETVGRVIVSNSSLAPPPGYFETTEREDKKTKLLVLPTMIEATGVSPSTAEAVANGLMTVKKPTDAMPDAIDGATVSHKGHLAVVLICSHRTRDKRCGVTAPILKKEFELNLREHGLLRDVNDDRAGGVPIYFVSHVGGHKYAGNVIVYRSTGEGIWMGRVEPKHCKAIVEETILQGRVYPETLRGAFKSDW
ncbi:Sucraseferredoxin-like protein [Lipomyces tetrasporus]|uniref:Sucraseferredoxin-like protein n=1 Tax=Lipomyces tetrasporus TaxID=54092 RepID=A0AAD7VP69_9ASCO|nr:Sucraseferredoxin-like protein [Lipomyces tetrasporus]KAJ8096713.1 Sucraseferredoxin-like protein [Lipomyces tetrasporus]